ncbi:hypothetical protein HAX54_028705 [Datura stramonium]|uniref:Phospholipase A1 n=1 Tax=Datura stramonium TaxID=4076 RepID=A0ABS8S9Q6_DATST|nr:hypothetical protein [Datura stramonium]
MGTAPTWHELLGSNNWEGLLEPLDLNLRRLILRFRDFCQVTCNAFNNDENSKYCGTFPRTMRNYESVNVLGARPESAEPLLHPKSLNKADPDNDNGGNNSDDDKNAL